MKIKVAVSAIEFGVEENILQIFYSKPDDPIAESTLAYQYMFINYGPISNEEISCSLSHVINVQCFGCLICEFSFRSNFKSSRNLIIDPPIATICHIIASSRRLFSTFVVNALVGNTMVTHLGYVLFMCIGVVYGLGTLVIQVLAPCS